MKKVYIYEKIGKDEFKIYTMEHEKQALKIVTQYEKQEWFKKLTKVTRGNIPDNLINATQLKELGITANEEDAVAWGYKNFSSQPYFLYEKSKYIK